MGLPEIKSASYNHKGTAIQLRYDWHEKEELASYSREGRGARCACDAGKWEVILSARLAR